VDFTLEMTPSVDGLKTVKRKKVKTKTDNTKSAVYMPATPELHGGVSGAGQRQPPRCSVESIMSETLDRADYSEASSAYPDNTFGRADSCTVDLSTATYDNNVPEEEEEPGT